MAYDDSYLLDAILSGVQTLGGNVYRIIDVILAAGYRCRGIPGSVIACTLDPLHLTASQIFGGSLLVGNEGGLGANHHASKKDNRNCPQDSQNHYRFDETDP